MRKTKRHQLTPSEFTLMDELAASNVQPLPPAKRELHLGRITRSLQAIRSGAAPTVRDVANVSDAVNLLDTLVNMRFNERKTDNGRAIVTDWDAIEFPEQTMRRACVAIAEVVKRGKTTGAYRFDAQGLHAVDSVVSTYADLVEVIPARVFIRAYRKCRQTIEAAAAGKKIADAEIELVEC